MFETLDVWSFAEDWDLNPEPWGGDCLGGLGVSRAFWSTGLRF